jgi:hypothetical protein
MEEQADCGDCTRLETGRPLKRLGSSTLPSSAEFGHTDLLMKNSRMAFADPNDVGTIDVVGFDSSTISLRRGLTGRTRSSTYKRDDPKMLGYQ